MPKLLKDRDLSEESFDLFLDWLSADREEAARKYEAIRHILINFFAKWVGADAEDLTDATINTVIEKAPQLIGAYTGDPKHYFLRVAHLKRLEYNRKMAIRNGGPLPYNLPDPQSSDTTAEKESMVACLYECLQKSRPEDRDLLLLYYREGGNAQLKDRLELAARLGCSINALRLQVFRLKEKLRVCIIDCQRRKGA
ncbi:MAG TPA: sigma-70 family RNA polymerase sigma factor [Blastocatellia bacterium]|nr:sigma-70 family RNA polymerase sigma factor [Blastocatellia bacterium]